MKKEVILVEHNIEFMEKKEKTAVAVLLFILPIAAATEAYRYYYQETYYWVAVGVVMLLIWLSVNAWNRFFLGISIFVQFIIAGSLIAFHMIASMMKGIEIIVGPDPSWQYGLLNFVDMFIIFLILCHVAFVTSHLMVRRRDFKEQKMTRKRRKDRRMEEEMLN